MARFAQNLVSWYFGLKKIIVDALYMTIENRAKCKISSVVLAPRLAKSLKNYLGIKNYDITIDIGFVDSTCAPSVVKRLNSCFNTQTIGNKLRRYQTEKATAKIGTLAIFSFNYCCQLTLAAKTQKKIAD